MEQLKSRKFWLTVVAVLTSLTAFINAILNHDTAQAIAALHGLLVATGAYLLVQGTIDGVVKHQEGKSKNEIARIDAVARISDFEEDLGDRDIVHG